MTNLEEKEERRPQGNMLRGLLVKPEGLRGIHVLAGHILRPRKEDEKVVIGDEE